MKKSKKAKSKRKKGIRLRHTPSPKLRRTRGSGGQEPKRKDRKNIKKVKKPKKPVKSRVIKAGLMNYMEMIVEKNMAGQLTGRKDICKCERCRLDVFAHALNHLPSKYVVTEKGSIYTKLSEMEYQLNADVTREVFKAIEVVRKNKRHS